MTFTVTNTNNGTNRQDVTDDAGLACVDDVPVSFLDGDYTVTESVPAGYVNEDDVQAYTVLEDTTCETAVQLEFVNTPLTNLTVSVDSQIDGGTASTIDCVVDSTSVPAGPAPANGDGSLTLNDLEPGTYTCTVVIDP